MSSIGPLLGTASATSFFSEPGFHVWCGTVAQGPEGDFYLLYSRWPVEKGFEAWVTHSEIAVARSNASSGPFAPCGVALVGAKGDAWDADVTHNPTIIESAGRYYLYYMGNRGDGTYWSHRNQQRIGVAWADHPTGPWHRSATPLIDTHPDSWDALMTSNSTVTSTNNSRWLMIYKTVSPGPMPFGGNVLCTPWPLPNIRWGHSCASQTLFSPTLANHFRQRIRSSGESMTAIGPSSKT